jgi:arabinogalactan endo-1,4-beta-galactosidase
VKDTLLSFAKAGINLDLVALGNEIRHGILWPVGYADVDVQPWPKTVANFSNLATLWKAPELELTMLSMLALLNLKL